MKRCPGGSTCFGSVSDLRWGGSYPCERTMPVTGLMASIDSRRPGRRGVTEPVTEQSADNLSMQRWWGESDGLGW